MTALVLQNMAGKVYQLFTVKSGAWASKQLQLRYQVTTFAPLRLRKKSHEGMLLSGSYGDLRGSQR